MLAVAALVSLSPCLSSAAVLDPWLIDLLGLLAIPALIVINGVFVAVEFALVAIRKTRVEEMVAQGVGGAKSIEAALANIDRSIAAAQLGITLASIALGAVGEPILAELIQPLFSFLPDREALVTRHTVASILALLLITVLHVILGEQLPKMAALQKTEATALWLARPLNLFARFSSWVLSGMSAATNWLLRRFGLQPAAHEANVHSVDELSLIVEDTEEAGLLDADQAEFVQNVFELTDKKVRDCMVPRDKMAVLDLNSSPEKVMDAVRQGAHTRMPVYEGNLDNVVGIVNTKDLFYLFSLQGVVMLEDAIYPATFLDPDENIANALRLFRRSRRPMALVRDDSGKILGLLTLEDVLEEIVGDIEDEHDRPVPRVRPRRRRPPPGHPPPGTPERPTGK